MQTRRNFLEYAAQLEHHAAAYRALAETMPEDMAVESNEKTVRRALTYLAGAIRSSKKKVDEKALARSIESMLDELEEGE